MSGGRLCEPLFRTLKNLPAYQTKPFDNLLAAPYWFAQFANWYNREHRHSGIRFVRLAQHHANLDAAILLLSKNVYEEARARTSQRWNGSTRNWERIVEVHLNSDRASSKPNLPDEEA